MTEVLHEDDTEHSVITQVESEVKGGTEVICFLESSEIITSGSSELNFARETIDLAPKTVVDTYVFSNGVRVYLALQTISSENSESQSRISYTIPPRFPRKALSWIQEKRKNSRLQNGFDSPKSDKPFYIDCIPEGSPTEISHEFGLYEHRKGKRLAGYYKSQDELSDAFVAGDHHVHFESTDHPQETATSFLVAFWLGNKRMDKPICITHTDPDTVLAVAMAAELIPAKYVRLAVDASRAADYGSTENSLAQVLSIAQTFNNLAHSIQILVTYFSFLDAGGKPSENINAFLAYVQNHETYKNNQVCRDFLQEYTYIQTRNQRIDSLFDKTVTSKGEAYWDENPATYPLEVAKDGTFSLWDFGQGVFLIDNESDPRYEYIDSDQLLSVLPAEIAKKARVLVFSRKIPVQEPWALPVSKRGQDYSSDPKQKNGRDAYEVKVRVVDSAISLYELPGLDLIETEKRASGQPLEWSFGGRREAGSTYRDGGSTKTGTDFASAIATSLAS